MAEQDIPPPTIIAMKIPIIRKGEYDIWSMRMCQYICHTDHNLWDVIVNGNLEEEPAPTTGETFASPAPKTAKQLSARRNQERVKSILLLAIPDEYLLKFHNVADAKSLWEAIKSRFGGNVESKKMQKNVLKHQFENFSTASNESLDKAYDRFQKLISQLEPDIDEIDIDDLYNNLRVYEDELKRSSGSNSASQNLAFLSFENTGSTNEVSTASGDLWVVLLWLLIKSINSKERSSFRGQEGIWNSKKNDMFLLISQRLSVTTVTEKGILLKNVDLEGFKEEDLWLLWAVNNVPTNESFNHKHCSSSSSDSEIQKCSKCLESFKCLQKNYDTEREKHNKAKLEIRGYEIALESLESKIIGHEKNELAWGEKYEFQNYELKCREIKINNLNLELEKAVKERDELKDKIAKWEESTKNLEEILKSQMSARDKTGLGQVMMSTYQKMKGFIKNGYKLSPPINRNFLNPRADISFAGLDEYAIRNKIIEIQTTELNNKTDETVEPSMIKRSVWELQKVRPETRDDKTNYANTEKPKSVTESVVSNPKINRDSVIIEDWTSDDKRKCLECKKTPKILGKFDEKSDEGYLLGYSTSSKAFRVYNKRTKRVEENLHINFFEDQPNVAGTGPNWMFNRDFLNNSMNYILVSVENHVNVDASTQDSYITGSSRKDIGPTQEYILLPLQPHRTRIPVKDVVQDA
ncbi:hypothetical protein Tco_0210751 [Tanacetum coccineum]